ncbi:MAG: SRPBCC family protein [Desulforhopalus sp.]
MTIYTLEKEQVVTANLDQTWSFLENPANLNTITPEDLNFSIISPLPETMYNGLIIEYRISIPLFGVKKWIAEIKHIRDKKSFVDEQRLGPYTFWYHYHELNETASGVRVFDRVNYVMPFGPVGSLLHALFVKKTLDRIFDYRKAKIAEILGQ